MKPPPDKAAAPEQYVMESYSYDQPSAIDKDAALPTPRTDIFRSAKEIDCELAAALAQIEALKKDAEIDWSWIRSVLAQGAAIQQDYAAGKFKGYEEYSARMDEAAREREDQITVRKP